MNEPLFDIPAPAPLHRPANPITAVGPMKWTAYSALHPRKCDDCSQYLLEQLLQNKNAPIARQARMKLSQGGKTVAFVCAEHRQIRDEDARK